MKKINFTWVLGFGLIGLSLILGSLILRNALLSDSESPATDSKRSSANLIPYVERSVMTIEDLADYLSVDPKTIQDQINADAEIEKLTSQTIHDRFSLIPFLKLSDGTILFVKDDINEWLKYKSANRNIE